MSYTKFRYLATGTNMTDLAFEFLIGHSTVHNIVRETCEHIWDVLAPIYVKKPTTEDEWKVIAKDFWEKWNMPNCLGAIDEKHVQILAPANSSALFYNYKGTFSGILMAIVDANYCFVMVDVGAYGSQSYGGVLKVSHMGKQFDRGEMFVPANEYLPNSNIKFPYFIIGDAAFPLKEYIMKPLGG